MFAFAFELLVHGDDLDLGLFQDAVEATHGSWLRGNRHFLSSKTEPWQDAMQGVFVELHPLGRLDATKHPIDTTKTKEN